MFLIRRLNLRSSASASSFLVARSNIAAANSVVRAKSTYDVIHPPEDANAPTIPPYIENFSEPIGDKRARLVYQSRKRGMLENGLLLGSFAKKYLTTFDKEQLSQYDRLINLPSNDWDIYYWAVERSPTPEEFDNEMMDMLKKHAKNENRESRITMPDL
jgi:succinate dehydrogenase assembly factor 2